MTDVVWTLERFYTELEARGGRDGEVPLIGSPCLLRLFVGFGS
jgi:hypothetical protein